MRENDWALHEENLAECRGKFFPLLPLLYNNRFIPVKKQKVRKWWSILWNAAVNSCLLWAVLFAGPFPPVLRHQPLHFVLRKYQTGSWKGVGTMDMYLFFCLRKYTADTRGHKYTECQAFYPVVRIGSPPLTRKRVLLPHPFWTKGGDTLLVGEGVGGPNADDWTLWYYRYMYSTIIPLHIGFLSRTASTPPPLFAISNLGSLVI